jgi:hypothetical protein
MTGATMMTKLLVFDRAANADDQYQTASFILSDSNRGLCETR